MASHVLIPYLIPRAFIHSFHFCRELERARRSVGKMAHIKVASEGEGDRSLGIGDRSF
ncbi:hypothetical protein ACE6H2_024629 [Prunus campanulata]